MIILSIKDFCVIKIAIFVTKIMVVKTNEFIPLTKAYNHGIAIFCFAKFFMSFFLSIYIFCLLKEKNSGLLGFLLNFILTNFNP